MRELYDAEKKGKSAPSGSQDMIGLIYPGINRLDYDFAAKGGVFPTHIESLTSARSARWLESVLHFLPIEPCPDGYNPVGKKNLDPKWIARLGQTGKDCFDAIRRLDAGALGDSFNDCMVCWGKILPRTMAHLSLRVELKAILRAYQRQYSGAMFSGCGGGYLCVVSEQLVPGALQIQVRSVNHPG